MRTYDNGTGFTVSFNARDADKFASRWPHSTVQGSGSFSFTADGDLTDVGDGLPSSVSGDAVFRDGGDWTAFSQDCRRWGEKHIKALRRRHEAAKHEREVLARGHF